MSVNANATQDSQFYIKPFRLGLAPPPQHLGVATGLSLSFNSVALELAAPILKHYPRSFTNHDIMSAEGSKLVSTGPLSAEEARWTRLIKTTYRDPNGVTRTWEHAERPTRPQGSDIDGVGILALLRKPGGPEIILQKQYRPPLDKICIEIPAGLVDAGETPEEAAVRELREETGYVGVPSETSMVMFNDPGFCTTNLRMVHVEIDMDLEENQNPVPKLEENEFIEVFTVPVGKLWEECRRLEAEGYAIDARVGNLAEGIMVAQKMKL